MKGYLFYLVVSVVMIVIYVFGIVTNGMKLTKEAKQIYIENVASWKADTIETKIKGNDTIYVIKFEFERKDI